MLLEVAANERKLQVKRAIALQKRKAQQKRNKIAKLDENCIRIEEQAAAVKRDVRRFDKRLMAVMKSKKKEMLNIQWIHKWTYRSKNLKNVCELNSALWTKK